MPMEPQAFQDFYPDDVSHCYGCGRLNPQGHHFRTYWEGEETITRFRPEPYHTAIPGYVYGGLIASLIDCHSTGSAAAAAYRAEGRAMDTDPPCRFVTASLSIQYVRPTPLGEELECRGTLVEVGPRKVVVRTTLSAAGNLCARAEVVAVRMPDHMLRSSG